MTIDKDKLAERAAWVLTAFNVLLVATVIYVAVYLLLRFL